MNSCEQCCTQVDNSRRESRSRQNVLVSKGLASSCIVSLHSRCIGAARKYKTVTESARATVVAESDFYRLGLPRGQLRKCHAHSGASGIKRWYERKFPYAAAI
jgi:hypothetical protein